MEEVSFHLNLGRSRFKLFKLIICSGAAAAAGQMCASESDGVWKAGWGWEEKLLRTSGQ